MPEASQQTNLFMACRQKYPWDFPNAPTKMNGIHIYKERVAMKRATLATTLAAPLTTIFCAALALGVVAPVLADDDITITRPHHDMASRLYLGASFGSAVYDQADDSSAAFALFGGYHLNEVLALDLSYSDLGKAEKGNAKAEASAFSLGVLGKLPVQTNLTLFGKVGLSSWDLDVSPDSVSDNDIDVSYGVGADYDISGTTAVRFGVDFYSLNGADAEEDINVFSIGFVYKP